MGSLVDTVLNMHTPTEDKTDDTKANFHKLQRVIDRLLKYHMKILLRDLNAQVGSEDAFKPTTGHDSLHELRNM
jgi:hypothetical protein